MIRISRPLADLLTAAVLVAIAVFLLFETYKLPPSPVRGYPGAAFLPRLILIYGLIFLAVYLFKAVRKVLAQDAPGDTLTFEVRDYAITLAAIAGFIMGLDWLGLEATAFLLTAILLYRRTGKLVMSLISGVIFSFMLWLIFVIFLNVSLPLTFLPRFLSF